MRESGRNEVNGLFKIREKLDSESQIRAYQLYDSNKKNPGSSEFIVSLIHVFQLIF